MELLGSSHLGEPKQYCRTGAQEDPWISAGDHPDLIVYGENGDANQWHTGTDGSIDALNKGEPRRCCCRSWLVCPLFLSRVLFAGGSNVWINALP